MLMMTPIRSDKIQMNKSRAAFQDAETLLLFPVSLLNL